MEICATNGVRPGTITQVHRTENFPKISSRIGKCKNSPQGCSRAHETPTDSPFSVISIKKSLQKEKKKRKEQKPQKEANQIRGDKWENLHLKN